MKWSNRNFLIFGIAFVSIGYLFSVATTSISIIVFALAWVLNYKEHNYKHLLRDKKLLFPVFYFVLVLLGVSYSLDISQAESAITRQISFLVLPLLFLTVKPLSSTERLRVIQFYIHVISLFLLVCFVVAMARQIGFYGRGGYFNWYYFYRYDFLEVFNQHPTFVTLYAHVSISFLLFKGKQIISNRIFLFFTIAFQSLGIILYGSRIGYVIFILVLAIYVARQLFLVSRGARTKLLIIYSIAFTALLYTMWSIPIIKERILFTLGYKQEYKFNNTAAIKKGSNFEQGRLLLWQDALEVIQQRPIFGYGTGSGKKVLLKKYQKENHTIFYKEIYNTHSAYLELELAGGVFLLGSFFLMLYALYRKSISNKDLVLFIYFISIAITGITEYIFGRVQGVVFFLFFYYFLSMRSLQNHSADNNLDVDE